MSILSKNNKLLIIALFMLSPFVANATVVEIRTSLGIIEVNLFDNATPETVANFLSYIDSGAYASHVVHRSVPGFVIQGGGFLYTGPINAQANFALDPVVASAQVVNEPELSNVRGTIAMAKIGGQPDSATSQWFINLSNSNVSLDTNNGGFAVFGQVLGDGMQVVDAIAALSRINGGGAFAEFPVRDINTDTFDEDDVVLIEDIVVIDRTVVTNSNIVPVRNTSLNQPTTGGNPDSGGGGSIFWLVFIALCGIEVRRHFK
ncbi:MAG: peptidyl-prolyl cis-trans isomerase A (cyclophilin A) [Flavobacteriales bacterium]|jgi:peptidyl-prolyl cis-trans isomerase A (cyclophilin A)